MTQPNSQIKNNATSNFLLMYGSSLLVVMLLAFFLFRAPSKIYKDQVKRYTSIDKQREVLLSKTNFINAQLSDLMQVEKANASNPDSGLERLTNPIIQRIDKTVSSLKEDSAGRVYDLVSKDVSNYLTAYNTFLTYHDLSKKLSPAIQKVSEVYLDKKPVDAIVPQKIDDGGIKLQAALTQNADYLSQIQNLTTQLQNITRQPVATNSNTDAADQWEKERQRLLGQLAGRDNELAAAKKKIKDLEDPQSTQSNNVMTASDKATITFQVVDQLIGKGLSTGDPSRGICSEAKRIIQEIKKDYPNKGQLDVIAAKIKKFCEVQ